MKAKPVHWNTTHGMASTTFYSKWSSMRRRCGMKSDKDFPRYGAKGIKVEWESFEDFKRDMFKSYESHVKKFGKENTTIDRIDNEKGYSKENCRWATVNEQNRNRRCARLLTFKGKTKTLKEWADILGISNETLGSRFFRKWPIEQILNPILHPRGRYARK